MLLFAFGDFAFNLFWQSIMLFLLFYYTDALTLPIGVAATTYMVASIWDGIANFIAGVLVDRRHASLNYGRCWSSVRSPQPDVRLDVHAAGQQRLDCDRDGVRGAPPVPHGLCRCERALPCNDGAHQPGPGDRAFVAGTRMLFGTAAAVTVALCTVPVGRWLTGASSAQAYFGAAVLFATIGAVILVLVGATYREDAQPHRPLPANVKAALRSLRGNRAFVALNAAMMAMIVAITVLNKSVLYYFKYLLEDPDAGQLALASMGLVSGIAIPLWMLLGRFVGLRALWLIAAGIGMGGLLVVQRRSPSTVRERCNCSSSECRS